MTLTSKSQLNKDIAAIKKLPDSEDDKQQMIVALLEGKSLHKAVRHTRAAAARDRRWGGVTQPRLTESEKKSGGKIHCPNFSSIDEEIGDAGRTLQDVLTTEDKERLPASRRAFFTDKIEYFLSILNDGTDTVAEYLGVTKRQAQILIKNAVDRLENQGSLLEIDERAEIVLSEMMRKRGESNVGRKSEAVRAAKRDLAEQDDLFREVV